MDSGSKNETPAQVIAREFREKTVKEKYDKIASLQIKGNDDEVSQLIQELVGDDEMDYRYWGHMQGGIGDQLQRMGRHSEAIICFEEALNPEAIKGNPNFFAVRQNNLGFSLEATGRYKDAHQAYSLALSTSSDLDDESAEQIRSNVQRVSRSLQSRSSGDNEQGNRAGEQVIYRGR